MQPISAQPIVKCLPVMHVSGKAMLGILKLFKNNNQKALLWPIFQWPRLLRHTLQRSRTYVQFLWQLIGLIKLHKPGKFHQYTICTFLSTAFQSPRSSRFGPRLAGFSSVTP